MVLAPKKKGEWRICRDYHNINKIKIKYRFPLQRMDDIMDCLSGAKYFIKIDLKSGTIRFVLEKVMSGRLL